MRKILTILVLFLPLLTFGFSGVGAQSNNVDVDATWTQCPDSGEDIVRCATYNCPKGDTSGDGACSIADEDAKLTDLRNDSLCANPPSGCGQVYYYNQSGTSCASRIKDLETCAINQSETPTFSTPTPQPTGTPTMTPTPTPISSDIKGANDSADSLPETGVGSLSMVLLTSLGALGVYLYSRFRVV